MTKPDASKALIYATWNERLLVFDEPDFPDVALQVPGGTMEPGETASDAAIREFAEETGIAAGVETMKALGTEDYIFARDGQQICHRRHYFHAVLAASYPQMWLHFEQSPFDGGPPIRFRLFWTTLDEAKARLGYGMERALHKLWFDQVGR